MIRRRRRRIHFIIPVASMGDIAFLLIIFFMLTTNFIKEAHVRLDPPVSQDIDRIEETLVSVSVDEDGVVWLQGKECPIEVLQGGVEVLLENKQERVVMLKVDRELPHRAYGPVLMALSRAGAEIDMVGQKEPGGRRR